MIKNGYDDNLTVNWWILDSPRTLSLQSREVFNINNLTNNVHLVICIAHVVLIY